MLDEVLGHVPLLNGQMSVTGTLTVRFDRPVPVGRSLQARAWTAKKEQRKWFLEGELVLASSGAILARAEGIFVLREQATHVVDFERWLAEQ